MKTACWWMRVALLSLVLLIALLFSNCGSTAPAASGEAPSNGSVAPLLQLSVNGIDMGTVDVGSNTTRQLTLTNAGTSSLTLSQLVPAGDFNIVGGLAVPLTLTPSQSMTVTVQFAPTAIGTRNGSFTISHSASAQPAVVTLTGVGRQGVLSVSPGALAFGSVGVGNSRSLQFQLSNTGNGDLTVSQLSWSGASYSHSGLQPTPFVVPAGQSVTATVQFQPDSIGTKAGGLVITHGAGAPVTVSFTGTGVTRVIAVSPSTIDFGRVAFGTPSNVAVTLTNSGPGDIHISAVDVTGTGFSIAGISAGSVVGGHSTLDFTAVFTPQVYAGVSGTVTITSDSPDSPAVLSLSGGPDAYFISPAGNDTNDALTADSAVRTFSRAFSLMGSGATLVVMDGTYTLSTTGIINHPLGAPSGVPPDGIPGNFTTVVAQNPGAVIIQGDVSDTTHNLRLGRPAIKVRYIKIQGIRFEGGDNALYNTDHVYIKECAFHSTLQTDGSVVTIGTNEHNMGNTYSLLEDVWVWGKERIALLVYRSEYVVVRRAVIRNDGCDSRANQCGSNSGNYMVGTTVYNSNHVSMQNILALDNIRGDGGYEGASDFHTAWHDNYVFPFGANEWLGDISLNSQLGGFGPEVDDFGGTSYQPYFTLRNIVAITNASAGLGAFNAQTPGSTHAKYLVVDGATIRNNNPGTSAFRIGPQFAGSAAGSSIRNVLVSGQARFAFNTAIGGAGVNVSGTWTEGDYNQAGCTSVCLSYDPFSTDSWRYPTRIETGSILAGAGVGGADIGANIRVRYGTEGTFYGDPQYNAATGTLLWPWPNETRIKAEMCASTNRGFCADPSGSITSYVWNYLNNGVPAQF
jgi:hypothetical protein